MSINFNPLHIAQSVPAARLAPYRAATATESEAIALYRWNIDLSSAFHEVLGISEVAVRHALDRAIADWNRAHSPNATPDWISHPVQGSCLATLVLDRGIRSQTTKWADKARAARPPHHPRKRAPISHDDLVGQLTYGNLNHLLPARERPPRGRRSPAGAELWNLATKNSFPNLRNDPHGHGVADRVSRLKALRNRVSHMENLLEVDPAARLNDVVQLINAIDPNLRDWVDATHRVDSVAAQRP